MLPLDAIRNSDGLLCVIILILIVVPIFLSAIFLIAWNRIHRQKKRRSEPK